MTELEPLDRAALRVAQVLETMRSAIFFVDRQWQLAYVNAQAEDLFGARREDLLGRDLWQHLVRAPDSQFEAACRQAVDSGEPVEFEEHFPSPRDHWYAVSAWPAPDGLSVYFHDITEGRRALEAAHRIDLLGEVSIQLDAELNPTVASSRLAALVVPAVADWCIVSLLDDEEQLSAVGAQHVDSALQPVLEEFSDLLRGARLMSGWYMAQAVDAGTHVTLPVPAGDAIAAVLDVPQAHGALARLAAQHGVVVPLVARGRVLGVISLFRGIERGPLEGLDLATTTEISRRAALSLDNARLYRQQRTVAETLQRSLLTEPPQPEGLSIAVRYEPAAAEAQIGGDWYDAFLQPGGATVVTIGDVVGHDMASAAAMGQVRGLLRGIAYTTGNSPAGVLRCLDEAMHGLQVATTATAVVARFEQSAEQRRQGQVTFRWSNAGHPPPMVLQADGTVDTLAAEHPELLLGIDPTAVRTESDVLLRVGATVLLYTDGLVERRSETIAGGLARLVDALRDLGGRADLPLDDLCDGLLVHLQGASREDDVALVAVRVTS